MPREALIAELKRLSPRELEATLGALRPAERDEVQAILRSSETPELPVSFEALTGLSPWLLKAADRARAAEKGVSSVTPATRSALAEALAKLAAAQRPKPTEGPQSRGWKALLRILARSSAP